jgi:hypothetical protein
MTEFGMPAQLTKETKIAVLIALGIVSVALTCCLGWVAVAFTGAGEGAYGPLDLSYGPFHWWMFLWPILVTGGNCLSRKIRIAAKSLVCAYYVWALANIGTFTDLPSVLFYHGSIDWMGFAWLLMFLSIHCLIWLPSLFLWNELHEGKVTPPAVDQPGD